VDDRSRFVDLSHTIEDGMPVLPGLPTPRIGAHLTHDASRDKYEDAEFFLGKVDMPANVGTYLDSPFHRFRDRLKPVSSRATPPNEDHPSTSKRGELMTHLDKQLESSRRSPYRPCRV